MEKETPSFSTILPPFREEEHFLRAHMCGHNGDLHFHSLLDLLQDAASSHADDLHIGRERMEEEGTLWVLSRLRGKILRLPNCGEKFTLTTYPTGCEGISASRQYLLKDGKGNDLVQATGFWLVLDRKNFRIRRPGKILEGISQNEELPRFFKEMEKFVPFPQEEVAYQTLQSLSFKVRHSDIDMNGHFNNALYAKLLTDTLSSLMGDHIALDSFQIDFTQSAFLGENLETTASVTREGGFQLSGTNETGNVCFRAQGRLAALPSAN